ncbi:SWIM zinc finger family protein [Bradyrhizobium sp.]|uniref:SWIM zinc finger family protein n=1 Tax=Bradyrhizobium sp. TaxID=376 RepID=UPI002B9B8F41|nr:SWIM zinc finger family protein [Bradyrhizobium sp.]HWX57422.1 SWIM zinc finger family protein [Bradyrhizobium sp.]
MRDYGYEWPEYVSVAEKRRQAEKELVKLRKQGHAAAPVIVQGQKIVKNFWGLSWCSNLERYSDFASRLPRGRSYVRNGCVIDLQIEKGKIKAKVSGSALYNVTITIAPVAAKRWRTICTDCAGTIDSLVELLQGRLAKSVMDRVCREGDGLFPAPDEIKLACSCPDGAYMCKHVAATLYGVGARLDEAPQLLFALRGVDEGDLLAGAEQGMIVSNTAPDARMVLAGGDMSALFGLDMADASEAPVVVAAKPARQSRSAKKENAPLTKRTAPPRNEQPLKSASARKGRAAKAAAGTKRAGKR